MNKPTDIAKLAVSRLERDAFTWWRQLTHQRVDFELGTLMWTDFKSELVNTFIDVDYELKLRRLLNALKQSTSVTNYIKYFRQIVLELGDQALDDAALLLKFMEGLKSDIQMHVLFAQPQFLSEAEQVIERADMALLSAGMRACQ